MGAGDASYLAPVLDQVLIHFGKVMRAYETI